MKKKNKFLIQAYLEAIAITVLSMGFVLLLSMHLWWPSIAHSHRLSQPSESASKAPEDSPMDTVPHMIVPSQN